MKRPQRIPYVLLSAVGIGCLIWTATSYVNFEDQWVTMMSIGLKSFVSPEAKPEYLISTPGCIIPFMSPYDDSIKALLRYPKPLVCLAKPDLTCMDGQRLRINQTATRLRFGDKPFYCQYETVIRPVGAKIDSYQYMPPVRFSTDVNNIKSDFIRVTCFESDGLHTHYSAKYTNIHPIIYKNRTAESLKKAQLNTTIAKLSLPNMYNFLLIGTDSISRSNSIRHLPKTRKFLMEDLGAVNFKGYNKVGEHTYTNLMPFYTGKWHDELDWMKRGHVNKTFDDVPFFWKDASNMGYWTLFAEDMPTLDLFHTRKYTCERAFVRQAFDYYYRRFALAVHNDPKIQNTGFHCIGSKPELHVMIDYVMDFLKLHRDHPWFASSFYSRLPHDDPNGVGAVDGIYLEFLKRLRSSGYLNNTVFLFFSDHGSRFGQFRNTIAGRVEDSLPAVYLSMPPKFREAHPNYIKALKRNANRLTTAFDIHTTLSSLLVFSGNLTPNNITQRGMNLLMDIPEDRSCRAASVDGNYCMCRRLVVVKTSSKMIRMGALMVVNHLNTFLRKLHGTLCATLALDNIFAANLLASSDNSPSKAPLYLISFQTQPGGAKFDVTIEHSSQTGSFKIYRDVIRTSRYGNQSHCVNDDRSKQYCLCA